ncbi:hypothetical protein Bca52824_096976 [Brassica carinata]|uniref:Uncharacterized protein n=1 Tax=Brassica carinata TaxID=52824 RepID=A0A8X7NVN9_BRACI|nr:hypothetical protein Bca52824_096976 [Brassica carinata]
MVNRVSCDSTQEGSSEQQITSDAVIEVNIELPLHLECFLSLKTIKHGLLETLQGNLLGLARYDSKAKRTLPGSENLCLLEFALEESKLSIFFKCVL